MSASETSGGAPERWWRAVVLASPSTLGVSWILVNYPQAAGHWSILLRPVAIVVAFGVAIELACWLVTRRHEVAAVAATWAIAAVIDLLLAAVIAGYVAVVWFAALWFRHVRRIETRRLPIARPVAIFSAALLMTSASGVIVSGSLSPRDDFPASVATAAVDRSQTELPNIYLLWLDAYPRADMLSSRFEYDNSAFLDGLGALGFEVYEDSNSGYDRTPATFLSVMSGDPEPALDLTGIDQKNELRRLIGEAPGFGLLSAAGYERITIRSPIVHASATGWDQAIDTGQINDFEVHLLSRSPLVLLTPLGSSALRGWVLQQHRDRIQQTIAGVVQLADPNTRRAVLAHLMTPHPPFLFAADGSASDPGKCWPVRCGLYTSEVARLPMDHEAYQAAMVSQVQAINGIATDAVEEIIDRDPNAVVVVMSDHGTRYSADDTEERFANLFAARTPDRPGLFGDAPTPSRLFERVIEAYTDGASP